MKGNLARHHDWQAAKLAISDIPSLPICAPRVSLLSTAGISGALFRGSRGLHDELRAAAEFAVPSAECQLETSPAQACAISRRRAACMCSFQMQP